MKPDPERIWLQNADDAKDQCEGRMWCEDKVWPDNPEDGEPTQYIRIDLYERALLDAHQRGLQRAIDWHRKNARICREIAQDDPRINETDRKRAGQAAIQHDASATGIETMMIEDRRAKAQEER